MARYRAMQQKDHFGRSIDTSIPFKVIDVPWREEVNIVPDYKNNYTVGDLHPVNFLNLVDWDNGEPVTSLEMLDYPRDKIKPVFVPSTQAKREKSAETIISIAVDGEEQDFYISKDSNTAYLVKCESLKIEAVVETKVTSKWTVKGKGAKSYRDNIIEAVKEFKK